MNFELSQRQQDWRTRATALGSQLPHTAAAADVVRGAALAGLLDADVDLLSYAVALDALAAESPSAAMVLALHATCVLSLPSETGLTSGERVGGLTLATEQVPLEERGRLKGSASWVAPLTERGLALVGVRSGGDLVASIVRFPSPGLVVEPIAGRWAARCRDGTPRAH